MLIGSLYVLAIVYTEGMSTTEMHHTRLARKSALSVHSTNRTARQTSAVSGITVARHYNAQNLHVTQQVGCYIQYRQVSLYINLAVIQKLAC